MENRVVALVVLLGLGVGLVFGLLTGFNLKPTPRAASDTVQLGSPEQDDFIIMVAEAYAGDRDLNLAQDRLSRLRDERVAARVEKLAQNYANQRDLIARNLALLAVALGSKDATLLLLSATSTATITPTATFTSTLTPTETQTPTLTPSLTPFVEPTFLPTPTPVVVAFAARQPSPAPTTARIVIVVVARPSPTPTRRPPTKTWTPRPSDTPTAAATDTPAPPPPVEFAPERGRWPSGVYFNAANVAPGQGYWHLTKAVYCDAFDNSDPHKHDFGCADLPGGSAGTNIYVMAGGSDINVIRPDGINVGGDRRVVGDKKSPSDMCNCTYSFESSNYRISIVGAPSDEIGGFCLCGVNFGWGSRAHVRYFLYFQYITR